MYFTWFHNFWFILVVWDRCKTITQYYYHVISDWYWISSKLPNEKSSSCRHRFRIQLSQYWGRWLKFLQMCNCVIIECIEKHKENVIFTYTVIQIGQSKRLNLKMFQVLDMLLVREKYTSKPTWVPECTHSLPTQISHQRHSSYR